MRIVLSAIGVSLLGALIAGLIFAFSYVATVVYLAGVLVAALGGYVFLRRQSGTDRAVYLLIQEVASQRRGRILFYVSRAINELVGALNWPIAIVHGIMIAIRSRTSDAGSYRNALFNMNLLPAWTGPPLFTFLMLAVIYPYSSSYPIKLISICLVISTFLALVSSSFIISVKESVLANAGNVKLSFALILLLNLGSAALSRSLIAQWSGTAPGDIWQSGYAIISASDLWFILEQHQLSPAEIAADRGLLANLASVSAPRALQALLAVLFYLGFLRIGFEIFSATREPRHYLGLAAASAGLGRDDDADRLLKLAGQERNAQVMRAAVRVRARDFAAVERIAKRICVVADIPFFAEEEALIGLTLASDVVRLDGATIAAYLDHRAPSFTDRHVAGLFAALMLAVVRDAGEALDALRAVKTLEDDPLFEVFLLDMASDTEAVRTRLDNAAADTVAGHLLRLMIRFSSMLDEDEGAPVDAAWMASAAADIERVSDMERLKQRHWQLAVGYPVIQRARAFHMLRFAKDNAELEALADQIREELQQSELYTDMIEMIDKVQEREIAALRKSKK